MQCHVVVLGTTGATYTFYDIYEENRNKPRKKKTALRVHKSFFFFSGRNGPRGIAVHACATVTFICCWCVFQMVVQSLLFPSHSSSRMFLLSPTLCGLLVEQTASLSIPGSCYSLIATVVPCARLVLPSLLRRSLV